MKKLRILVAFEINIQQTIKTLDKSGVFAYKRENKLHTKRKRKGYV